MALVSIFEELLPKLLTSQCQFELQKENALTLTESMMYHVLFKNKDARKLFSPDKGLLKYHTRLIYDSHGNLRTSINLSSFDVTVLVALIKNVNRKNCFQKFNNPVCNTSCINCKVKVAVEDIRRLRNTSAHENDSNLQEFLEGTKDFDEFPRLKTFEIFMDHFWEQFQILHLYLSGVQNFPLSSIFGTYLFSLKIVT